jgi:hypothetical protein
LPKLIELTAAAENGWVLCGWHLLWRDAANCKGKRAAQSKLALKGSSCYSKTMTYQGSLDHVGTLMGKHGVNIAAMSLSSGMSKGGQALTVLNLDSVPGQPLLDELLRPPGDSHRRSGLALAPGEARDCLLCDVVCVQREKRRKAKWDLLSKRSRYLGTC